MSDCDHDWRTITVKKKGHDSLSDYAYQECQRCGRFRKEEIEWVDE